MPGGLSANLLIRGGARTVRGGIILGASALLLVAVVVWSLLADGDGQAASVAVGAFCVGAAMFAAILGAILTDSRIRSVAKFTFVECLRLKLTAVFIVLMIIAVAAVYYVEGDGTLGGRIRNFLSYSNGMISLLLSVMTVFLAISVVTRDVRTKQIFILATKPLARWEYIVGRWLGILLLDAGLVLVAGVVIYGLAQHLRGKAGGMDFPDRRTVETEVFTSRERVPPDPVRVEDRVTSRLKKMRSEGRYDRSVDAFLERADGNRQAAVELLKKVIAEQVIKEAGSVGPMKLMRLDFSGIKADATPIRRACRIAEISHPKALARIEVPTEIIGHLTIGAPVKIEDVQAHVYRAGRDFMDVWFDRDDMSLAQVRAMAAGQDVQIELISAIQLVYKAKASGRFEGEQLRGKWLLINPQTGWYEEEPAHDVPIDAPQTFTVSAAVVADDGRTTAWYANATPVSVLLNRDDVAVLYRVGGFGWNLARGTVLVLFRCAFLAGLGLLAGSALSFPVSCMACFVLYTIALGRGFMTKAVSLGHGADNDLLTVVGHYVMKVMSVVLPDFASSSPVDSLVGGMYISWGFFGQTLMTMVAFRGMMLLGLACLIFHRRELARVQV